MKRLLKQCTALVTAATLAHPAFAVEAGSIVTQQPNLNSTVAPYAMDPERADPALSNDEMIRLIRHRVKYVFVLFNENESFDHEYGTFPGVNGLYSDGRRARVAPTNTQSYTDVNGGSHSVTAFRIGPQQNATFMDSVDHSHTGLASKLHVVDGAPRMDGFSQDEYSKYAKSSSASSAQQKQGAQFASLVMSHIDCDTIPFFWQYANRFTIFDNIFATEDTPSTPNAVAMLAGQAGETQWVKHPDQAAPSAQPISGTINGTTYSGTATPQGVPLVNDPQPYYGSAFDTTTHEREPTGPKESWAPSNTAVNLTFASVPLTLAGRHIHKLLDGDENPSINEADIQKDIRYIHERGDRPVPWRWYENGYTPFEPKLPSFAPQVPHAGYVSHHNGAQYFGYISNNFNEQSNIHGEHDFFADIQADELPREGGVFYIRGGYYNLQGLLPPIQNPNYPNTAGLTTTDIAAINANKAGDDDHPGYSDHQLSEAMNARVINFIASKPEIWRQSAIIITYDESDGFYDHVPPHILSYGPDGLPLSRGVRIPLLLISPFARAGAVSHAEGDHNAVIETINAVFDLPALSSLPDEKAALAAGNSAAFNKFAPAGFQQQHLGPRDTNSALTDSLLSGFSPKRLKGQAPELPASYAEIPNAQLTSLPHFQGKGCEAIGVTPTDAAAPAAPPAGFNTLPSTLANYN